MADGMNEHREIAVIESQPSRGTWVLAVGTLWGCWLVSIYPVVQLFLEFGQRQIEDCGAEWWYHAWSYPHFFIYPVTFGLVSTVFLHRPWIRVVHYLFSLTGPAKLRHFAFILCSMVVVVLFISFAEFSRAPQGSAAVKCDGKLTEATRSLWDLPPDAMKGDEVERVHDLIAMQCRGETLEDNKQCEYGQKMAELWEAGGRRDSSTVRAYKVGFVTMTSLFVFLFAAIAIVRSWKPKIRSHPEGKRMAGMLLVAMSFAMGWVIMRVLYHLEKSPLYPEDPQWEFEILILGIFLIFLVHAAAYRWSRFAHYDWILKMAISIIGIVVFSMEIGELNGQAILLIFVACILFAFTSIFPFILEKLHYQGVFASLTLLLSFSSFSKSWKRAVVPELEGQDEEDKS